MNKKGFTLVEILVVIVLLGILTVFTTTSIIKVREKSMNDFYNNKIIYIETGAREWGNDNLNLLSDDCYYVNVDALITGGYITGDNDDKTKLFNPLDKTFFNNKCICIKYENTYFENEGASTTRYEVTSKYNNGVCGG